MCPAPANKQNYSISYQRSDCIKIGLSCDCKWTIYLLRSCLRGNCIKNNRALQLQNGHEPMVCVGNQIQVSTNTKNVSYQRIPININTNTMPTIAIPSKHCVLTKTKYQQIKHYQNYPISGHRCALNIVSPHKLMHEVAPTQYLRTYLSWWLHNSIYIKLKSLQHQ